MSWFFYHQNLDSFIFLYFQKNCNNFLKKNKFHFNQSWKQRYPKTLSFYEKNPQIWLKFDGNFQSNYKLKFYLSPFFTSSEELLDDPWSERSEAREPNESLAPILLSFSRVLRDGRAGIGVWSSLEFITCNPAGLNYYCDIRNDWWFTG